MISSELHLTKFNIENLAGCIKRFLSVDYSNKSIMKLVNENVIPRIEVFLGQAKYFYFEDNYIESAWKEMVSLHYVNTSYKIKQYVARIHLFTADTIESDKYLGYFNIRPIDEFRILLSYIVPNWKVLLLPQNKKHAYVMAYEDEVHIHGITLNISTFRFFAQDSVVASCVHANILMISRYLNKVFGYKGIRLRDIDSGYSFLKTKCFPTKGLLSQQIIEIFNNNHIPVKLYYYSDEEDKSDFDGIIRTYVESGIPVILCIEEHAILLVGHLLDDNGNYEYLIFDDSAAIVEEIHKESQSFISDISWEQIRDKLTQWDFIVVPEHERVYMNYGHINELIINYMENWDFLRDFEIDGEAPQSYSTRIILVDNSYLKGFLLNNAYRINNKAYMKEYNDFLNNNSPHYIWYYEIVAKWKNDEMIAAILADPTYNIKTLNNIFFNNNPFFLKKPLGLLKELPE